MRALVLSGGSALGAYQVGVLKYVAHHTSWTFDAVYGVSVGAINGGKLVMHHKHKLTEAVTELEKMWIRLGEGGVYKRWFPFGMLHVLGKRRSLFDTSPLRALIQKEFDPSKVSANGYSFAVGVTSWNSGKYKVVKHTNSKIEDYISASAAQPLAFPPVKIDGEWWVDGGIRNAVPVKDALDAGADHLLLVLTEAPEMAFVAGDPASGVAVGERALAVLAHEVFQTDLETARRGTTAEIIAIRPGVALLADPLDFGVKQVRRLIQHGYEDVAQFLK